MNEKNKLRQRSDIPVEDTWATEDLYANEELWEQDLTKVQSMVPQLASYGGKLGASAADLLAYLTLSEEVDVLGGRGAAYCMRKADEDTRVSKYQAMRSRFMSAMGAMSAATSFETPEIMAIDEQTLESFYAQEPGLERYRRMLTDSRRLKDHVLSPAEEKLLAASREMAQAPQQTFGMFENADLKFPNATDSQGNSLPVTQGSFVSHETSEDRVLRKSAYESMYRTLAGFKNTAASLLSAQVKQLQFYATARKYPSSLDAALSRTNVPTEVYLNLIEAVHRNVDKMHRYVALSKKLLCV